MLHVKCKENLCAFSLVCFTVLSYIVAYIRSRGVLLIVTCISLLHLKKNLQNKMPRTPNFDDLKKDCKLHRKRRLRMKASSRSLMKNVKLYVAECKTAGVASRGSKF